MLSIGVAATPAQPQCASNAQSFIPESATSVIYDFELEQLTRNTAEITGDGKLAVGGSIFKRNNKSVAALAMIDLSDNSLDYAKVFSKANVITTIAAAPKGAAASIVALATQKMLDPKAKAFIIELSSAGDLIKKPISMPLSTFAGRGSAALAHASLLVDNRSNVVVAFGHENHQYESEISVINT